MAIDKQSLKAAVSGNQESGWKTQTYAVGVVAGLLFGLLAAYLFARAAEENATQNGGKPESISTGQLVTLGLAALGLIRQITELGKTPKKR